jgi:hypothetical protein
LGAITLSHRGDTQQAAEQTLCRLPLISLLPDATLASLQSRFGPAFQGFAEIERLVLAAVSGEGSITHARLREMTTEHSRDVTLALDSLVRRRILERGGRGRAAYYFFPGEPPAQDGTALSFFVPATAISGRMSAHTRVRDARRARAFVIVTDDAAGSAPQATSFPLLTEGAFPVAPGVSTSAQRAHASPPSRLRAPEPVLPVTSCVQMRSSHTLPGRSHPCERGSESSPTLQHP